MGSAFAERLLDAGCELVVQNRSRAKADALAARGATVAESVAGLAEAVDIVLMSLSDDEAFESVAAAVVAAARPGTILADMSTVSPGVSARVASLADDASVPYLRAPVSGNRTAPARRLFGDLHNEADGEGHRPRARGGRRRRCTAAARRRDQGDPPRGGRGGIRRRRRHGALSASAERGGRGGAPVTMRSRLV